jgi:hypothetical protein
LISAKLAQGEFTLQHKRRPLTLLRVQDVRYWHEADKRAPAEANAPLPLEPHSRKAHYWIRGNNAAPGLHSAFCCCRACVFTRVAEQVRDVLNHTTIDDAIRLSSEGETRLNGSRSPRVGTPLS